MTRANARDLSWVYLVRTELWGRSDAGTERDDCFERTCVAHQLIRETNSISITIVLEAPRLIGEFFPEKPPLVSRILGRGIGVREFPVDDPGPCRTSEFFG